MKLWLSYCLLCLFAMGTQSKPEITKLFPIEGLEAYRRQVNNITKPLDKFWGKLRATYNFVFHQSDNASNVEKILTKNTSDPDLRALKLIWADQTNLENYTNLKYPNSSFLDHVKSLLTSQDYESRANSSGLGRNFSVEIKSTIKASKDKASRTSSDKEEGNFSNKTETSDEDDWFNDVQPLELLELQDEELSIKQKNVEIATPGTTFQLPVAVGRQLIEWLGSLFGLTYSIYAKLSGTACGNEKKTQ